MFLHHGPLRSQEPRRPVHRPRRRLLVVLREGQGVGVQTLAGLGVDTAELRTVYERTTEALMANDTTVPAHTEEDLESINWPRRNGWTCG